MVRVGVTYGILCPTMVGSNQMSNLICECVERQSTKFNSLLEYCVLNKVHLVALSRVK